MDGSASIGLEQALLGHSLGFAPFAAPTQVYVSLCLASTVPSETVPGLEASGGGYARMPATFALIAGPSNIAANTTSIEFPQALSSWGQIGFFELWDAASGGNRLYWGQLVDTADFTTPLVLQVSAGDITRFSAGTLGVQASTGAGGTASIGAYLPLAGGQMAGPLLLAGDPTDYLQAATKQYVDAHSGTGGGPGFLPLSGGTMLGPLGLGPSLIWGATTATGFGTAVGQVPVFINYQGSGLAGLHLAGRLVLDLATSTANDFAVLQINRTTTFASSAANLNSVLRLSNTIGANDGTKNWGFASTQTSAGNQGGQNVGAFIQATRTTGGTDFVLGTVSDARDTTGLASSTAKQLVGIEVDVECNRADDGVNATAFGGVGVRKGINIVAMRYDSANTAQTEVSQGILFSASTPSNLTTVDNLTNFQSGMGFAVNTQIRNVIDTRGAITPTGSSNPVSAVTMSAGHIIDLNGGPALNSAPGNYLQYTTTGTPRLRYMVGGTEQFAIGNTGQLSGPGIGYDIGDIPGPIVSQGGIAALRPPAELIFQRNAFAATDGQDFRFRRITAFTGGNQTNINKVIEIEASYGAGDACQNWPFLVKAMNSSTSGGTLTSAYVQAWRNAGSGQTTGLITDVADFQGTASSVSGQLTSQEWDLNATGADDMANGSRFGGIGGRQMAHVVFANMSSTINSEYTAGIWFGTGINGSASAYVDSLLCVQGGAQPTLIRNFLDSRGAAPPPGVTDPVAAVRMSAGHIIDLNGGPALNSAAGAYLQYRSGKLYYVVAGVDKWSIDASGNVRAAGTITGSVTP